jgi:hypothetical protein
MLKTFRAGVLAFAALCLAPIAAHAACPTAPTYTGLSGLDAATAPKTLQTVTSSGSSQQLSTPLMHGNDGTTIPKALAATANCELETADAGVIAQLVTANTSLADTTPRFVKSDHTTPGVTDAFTLPDLRPSSGTITALDAATTTIAGQSGVTLITGTPTASSFQTQAFNGMSSATILTTGTFVETLNIEASSDGGTVYAPIAGRLFGSALTTTTITAPGEINVDVSGLTNLRVRSTAFTSGTATVRMTVSPAATGAGSLKPPTLVAGSASVITTGGTAVTMITGQVRGCYITNPPTAAAQGIATAENVYIDPVTTATTTGNGTNVILQPGQTYNCIPGQTNNLSVNAATSSHALTVVKW